MLMWHCLRTLELLQVIVQVVSCDAMFTTDVQWLGMVLMRKTKLISGLKMLRV